MNHKIAADQERQASALLPALATLTPKVAEETIELFTKDSYTKASAMSVAKTHGRLRTPEARTHLELFRDRGDQSKVLKMAWPSVRGWK